MGTVHGHDTLFMCVLFTVHVHGMALFMGMECMHCLA